MLHAEDIADLDISRPPALSGFLRLLYVLTARVTGLDSFDSIEEWRKAREFEFDRGSFDPTQVRRYFWQYGGRFELFHAASEAPFCQDPRLLEECRTNRGDPTSSGVNKLVLGRASGQSFAWHSHTHDSNILTASVDEAFFALLTWLYYGSPGRCTPRQVSGTTAAYTKAGPLRGSVSYHPIGRNLFETLLMGLPYFPPGGADTAPWEVPPDELSDISANNTAGIGNSLAGQFRHAILLEPNESGNAVMDARITWARESPQKLAPDPFLIHRTDTDGSLVPEKAQIDRAAWRDLDCLVGIHAVRERPAAFKRLDDLVVSRRETMWIKALGFDQDRTQVKDRQYFADMFSVEPEFWQRVDPARFNRVRQVREAAEYHGRNLADSLNGVWQASGGFSVESAGPAVPWYHFGIKHYWEGAGNLFWPAIASEEHPLRGVINGFIQASLKAFDLATTNLVLHRPSVKIVASYRNRLQGGYVAAWGAAEYQSSRCGFEKPATEAQRNNLIHAHAGNMVRYLSSVVLADPSRREAVRVARIHPRGIERSSYAYKEICGFLPRFSVDREDRAFIAVAAMMCDQPESNRHQDLIGAADANNKVFSNHEPACGHWNDRSLGSSCAAALSRDSNSLFRTTLEARLTQLCRSSIWAVYRKVPYLAYYLRGLGVTINWAELVCDLSNWESARESIAARWLSDFYRRQGA